MNFMSGFLRLCLLLFLSGIPITAQHSANMPGFIIPNSANKDSQKQLVGNPEVIAFLPMNHGRVMFTSAGAYFSSSAPAIDSTNFSDHTHFEKAAGGKASKAAVFQIGFSRSHLEKRHILPTLEDPFPGPINFLVGPREQWQIGVTGYRKLAYPQAWDGVDLVYHNATDTFRYQVNLQPRSQVNAIALATGAEELQLTQDGDLLASITGIQAQYHKPFAYQMVAGKKQPVEIAFVLLGNQHYGFKLGPHNESLKTEIHASITWSSFVGGPGGINYDSPAAIALGPQADVFVTGITAVGDFPLTPGAFSTTSKGQTEVFVTKMSPDGSQLIYSTLVGGSGSDSSAEIAIDSTGNAVVVGTTFSMDFPTTPQVVQNSFSGTDSDGFVFKLNQDGSDLIFATYFGGTNLDQISSVNVDPLDTIFLTGLTYSLDFPLAGNPLSTTLMGTTDTFFSVLSEDGSNLILSTYLGGSGNEEGLDLELTSTHAYLTGSTTSNDFPLAKAVASKSKSTVSGKSVFVCKVSTTDGSLSYTALLDGNSNDLGQSVAVASDGSALVTGRTQSFDFPNTPGSMTPGPFQEGGVFVSKISPDGQNLVFSARFPGSFEDVGNAIALDSLGQIILAGKTQSNLFPVPSNGLDPFFSGRVDGFVIQLEADGSAIRCGTFLGGSENDFVRSMVFTSEETVLLVGETRSDDFPLTANAYQDSLKGDRDVFVTSLSSDLKTLLTSTYLGGSGSEYVTNIAVDTSSNVYIAGNSNSGAFPTTPGAVQASNAGGSSDTFVAKLDPDGRSYLYATFLGGTGQDAPTGLVVDSFGNAYVAGLTFSEDFPVTSGSINSQLKGSSDIFASKLNHDGTDLIYSTLIGGEGNDSAEDILVDPSDRLYLAGTTTSSDFPVTPNAFQKSPNSILEGFLVSLNPQGNEILYSSFLGGSGNEEIVAIARDRLGFIYVAGNTTSIDFPASGNAFQRTLKGANDGFITKFHPSGASLFYSSYFGGSFGETVFGMDVDEDADVYLIGKTSSPDLPVTPGALSSDPSRVFVAKIDTATPLVHYCTYLEVGVDNGLSDILVNSEKEAFFAGVSRSFPTTLCGPEPPQPLGSSSYFGLLNAEGTGLLYSTMIGGNYEDSVLGLALDGDHRAIVGGLTRSFDFLTTPGVVGEIPLGWETGFLRKISPTFPVSISPINQVLGLSPATFRVQDDCGTGPVDEYLWRTYPPTPFLAVSDTIIFESAPSETTRVDVTLKNELGHITTRKALLLVAQNPEFTDFNQDGCNSIQDLWDLAQFWNQPFPMDADGNERIDVLDLLFVSLNGECP